jgi:glycine/D-amino acid oxidase-like deaminating enzyme
VSTRVVIVGGGVIGSAVAYFLKSMPGFAGDVTIVERDPSFARASSALSASSIRQQFSTPVNIAISRFGIGFLREAGRTLAVDGDAPAIGLHESGYLFLVPESGRAVLEQVHAIQRAESVDVAILDPAALVARFPWLSPEGVAAASLGLSGEGWFDGYALMQAFRRKARALGTTLVTGEVTGFRRAGGRVEAAVLADGTAIAGDWFVNAGGPWAASVAARLDIDLPVRARRRCVFVVTCPDRIDNCPLMIDTSGVWVRPEGDRFICGISPEESNDPDDLPLEVDHTQFDDIVWPALAARVPAFERLRVVNSWAGYYEFNIFDHNGIVGPHPSLANVIFANGFSGHGIQQSPAVGRGVAELIAHGTYRTLDLSALAFTRIVRGEKLVELAVI